MPDVESGHSVMVPGHWVRDPSGHCVSEVPSGHTVGDLFEHSVSDAGHTVGFCTHSVKLAGHVV